ncbi:unnamed protein product [Caenorhabditis nigoni]
MNIADKIDAARQELEQIEINMENKFAELKDAEKKLSEQPANEELLKEVEKVKDEDVELQNAKNEKEEEIANLELRRDWMLRAAAARHRLEEEARAEEQEVERDGQEEEAHAEEEEEQRD